MTLSDKQRVICLIAPTASGKTALAYELYDTGRYSLISVDSALIYRDMNIGTAKPTAKELISYPHALVDIIDPDQSYSVAQFVKDAQQEIANAHSQGKIPVLVGGTMMYYMALLEGINDIPATLPATREQVSHMIAEQGIEKVHQYLYDIDSILAQKLKPNDSQRIGRAIEVYLQTGKPLSEWQSQPVIVPSHHPEQHWQIIAIMPDRAWLHEGIDLRLQLMWRQGFLQEVIELQQRYHLHEDMPSMRSVGYRQAWQYLAKIKKMFAVDEGYRLNWHEYQQLIDLPNDNIRAIEQARQDMENEALYATRQLAKRQYTWIRKIGSSTNINQRHEMLILNSVVEAKNRLC